MNAYGKLTEIEDGIGFHVFVAFPDTYLLEKRQIVQFEIRMDDGRTISNDQRKKIYATMSDIADWSGYDRDEYKNVAKYLFIAKTGYPYFSLSNVDMTTANEFLNYLIGFCLEHDIPTMDSLLDRSPDISRYLYSCLANKRCCICGKKCELHHADHVGAGRNRKEIMHLGMRAEALCRIHHMQCHTEGQQTFDSKHHIYGIKLDRHLCDILKLK